MDGRIHDADDLFSSLNSTMTAPQQNSGSENFINLDDDDDDEDCNKTTSTTKTPMVFDRFYESSSEDEFYSTSNGCSGDNFLVQTAEKRLDYMIRYLDRKLSTLEANHNELNRALPEFVASGGGRGIFKLPVRTAVHPGRPPSLELRPHPFRETQVGCSLSVLEGTGDGGQLWAGSECGVRVWDMKDMYAAGMGEGEEEEVPYYESARTSPTLCTVVDEGNKVVWSGHKDGKIMCWKMYQSLDAYDVCFREYLSWQAHRGPVLSMVISSYGDLWSGSEGGAIAVWPCEAITKALWLTLEERPMGGLIVERSCIDLKNQVTMNGVSCSVLAADVRYMVSDHFGTKVWSAGYLSFALWDAYTRELLKVFNIDGQAENLSVIQDVTAEDEARMKFASGPKSFFQRSRSALLGAADAVRRVAVKGSFGDDNRRTESLIITADGVVWTGSTSGLLVQWDGNGNRLQEMQYHCYAINCLCTFGLRIWAGYASGTLQVLDLDGNLLGEWVAHSSPIIRIAVGPGYIFTLANDGGIRGWSISSPGQLDSILRPEIAGKEFLYTRQENLKILAGTWNVAQGRAKYDSLISWLGSALVDVDIVAVGLQEMEMGAGFLAMSAARETMQVGLEGSSSGQWWLDMIGKTLNEGSCFQRVGSRQLAGMLIAVWVRNTIRSNVGDVDVAAVPCGFGRAIGNKGAVGLRMRVYSRIMCFVNCHFAAHLEAVSRRNADFDHVYRTMSFCRSSQLVNALGTHQSIDGLPELSKADMVVFLGDFNYRLDGISYDEARDFVSQRSFDWLKEKDQLGIEMKAGSVFQGMREAIITFPPTYKFERHQAGLAGYDSGEKKRIPAWCDRILYRDSRPTTSSTCNLNCPVVSSILQYEACMDVTDSDHKPVRCIFNVELARVDESIRRQEFGEIIRSNEKIRNILEQQYNVPEVILSTNTIILQDHDKSVLRISNRSGKDKALFRVICEGQCTIKDGKQASSQRPRGSFGFPQWLQVKPTVGIIEPNQIMEISLHLHHPIFEDGDPQSQCQNKEGLLIVEVRGSCTSKKKDHRVHVRRAPRKSTPTDQNHTRVNANLLHRSDINWLSGSSDVFDHLHELYTP